jgi:tetratricopeptide (TPR) repeat protein
VANTLDSLGRIAIRRGNVADASALLKRALEIDRTALGEENYQTAVIAANFADVYVTEGKFSDAEPILRHVVRVLEEKRPPGDLNTASARAKMGRCLLGLKLYKEAGEQLSAADEVYEKQAQAQGADIAKVRADLAKVRGWLAAGVPK